MLVLDELALHLERRQGAIRAVRGVGGGRGDEKGGIDGHVDLRVRRVRTSALELLTTKVGVELLLLRRLLGGIGVGRVGEGVGVDKGGLDVGGWRGFGGSLGGGGGGGLVLC